jgi:DNA-binding transcriptional regulator YdaS (Cro superfamily)
MVSLDMASHSVLRDWRQRKKMTQTALAGLIGVTKPQVSRWETGQRPISAFQAREIERATGIPRARLRPDIFGPVKNRQHNDGGNNAR